MAKRFGRQHAPLRAEQGGKLELSARARTLQAAGLWALLAGAAGTAQAQAPRPLQDPDSGWQACQRLADDKAARLACFDRWAQQQRPPAPVAQPAPAAPSPPALASTAPPEDKPAPPPVDATVPATRVVTVGEDGCRDMQYSTLSRFWELEEGSDCGTFGLRGYRPINVSFALADGKPPVPTSPAPNHTGTPMDYQPYEMRLNLSVRTKLAQGLLTGADPARKDSLWFGYTQQSSWQVFNNDLSRPFRTTDHEPEAMYVYPTDVHLPGGWRWRHVGLGIAHQSNGQSEPLSRSWNRVYLMGGVELGNSFLFTARAWKRISEDPGDDDNPDIVHYLGRAEFSGWWYPDGKNSFGLTVRTFGKGSQRLEWMRAIGDPAKSSLRFHMQLFNGYGDTLVDYNRRRTVLSIGLSLVDF